jgi:hypothetical protein
MGPGLVVAWVWAASCTPPAPLQPDAPPTPHEAPDALPEAAAPDTRVQAAVEAARRAWSLPAVPALDAEDHPADGWHPVEPWDGGEEGFWWHRTSLLADRTRLETAFRARGYSPEPDSLAWFNRVEAGVGQPRFHGYAWRDTPFVVPARMFHPASTVKLAAAVSALSTLSTWGLDADTRVRFDDVAGRWDGPVRDIVREALLHSSNADYNRLMVLAGHAEANGTWLSPRWGLPHFTIQSRYGGRGSGSGFRSSPEIAWSRGEERGVIPARRSDHEGVACAGNCTTLVELQEVLRRVMYHEVLPEAERFPIRLEDVTLMRAQLLRTRNRFGTIPREALGEGVSVHNNVGRIPGIVLVENAHLTGEETGRQVLVTVSIPFPRQLGDDTVVTLRWLQTLTLRGLQEVLAGPPAGPGLQHDAGPAPRIHGAWRDGEENHAWRMVVVWPGEAARARAWVNGEVVWSGEVGGLPWDTIRWQWPRDTPMAWTLETWRPSGEPLSYHGWLLHAEEGSP